jgi:hypothetical protein
MSGSHPTLQKRLLSYLVLGAFWSHSIMTFLLNHVDSIPQSAYSENIYLQGLLKHSNSLNGLNKLNGATFPISTENDTKIDVILDVAQLRSNPTSLLVGDALENTVKTLFLSPNKPGEVIGIVNLMDLPCQHRVKYMNSPEKIFQLRQDDGTVFQQKFLEDEWLRDIQSAVHFQVGMKRWMEWCQNPPANITIVDRLQGTSHQMNILVDPHLAKYNDDVSVGRPFLAAMTWVHKNRRYYQNRGDKYLSDRPNSTTLSSRDDNTTLYYSALRHWLDYHRRLGVSRFYVIDQEPDLDTPNVKDIEDLDDVVYIRSPFSYADYYVDRCEGAKHVSRTMWFTMQYVLESTVSRMANAEWILVTDPDEFIVPSGFANIPALVQHYQRLHCDGPYVSSKAVKAVDLPSWKTWNNVSCKHLQDTTSDDIYEIQFYQVLLNRNNYLTYSSDEFDRWALTKCIYRTSLVGGNSVHSGYTSERGTYVSTKVSPRRGFMAHFKGAGPFDFASLLSNVSEHSNSLQDWDYEQKSVSNRQNSLTVYNPNATTIQSLFLSPSKPGFLVGIVSLMHVACQDRVKYANSGKRIFQLKLVAGRMIPQSHMDSGWIKDIQNAVYFNIGEEKWNKWVRRPPGKLRVVDTIEQSERWCNVLVDPRLSRRESPFFLSATTWINKSRRYYKGRKTQGVRSIHTLSEETGNSKGLDSRNDTATLYKLDHWMDHHRNQWVSHFYIIDQENDMSIPNIKELEERSDVTYIRAPYGYLDYYIDQCQGDQKVRRMRDISAQYVLETMVLRMAHTKWMLMTDLDEYIVPAGYPHLPALIKDNEKLHCDGPPMKSKKTKSVLPSWKVWDNVKCQTLESSGYEDVFEIQFYQGFVDGQNRFTPSSDDYDLWALTKCVYRSDLVSGSLTHFSYPLDARRHGSTKASPHRGFMAHFKGDGPIDLDALLPKLEDHANSLKDWGILRKRRQRFRGSPVFQQHDKSSNQQASDKASLSQDASTGEQPKTEIPHTEIPSHLIELSASNTHLAKSLSRIKRLRILGQHQDAEHLVRLLIKSYGTKIVDEKPTKTTPYMQIPSHLIELSKSDPVVAKRIYRIRRWRILGQHQIAETLLKKMLGKYGVQQS